MSGDRSEPTRDLHSAVTVPPKATSPQPSPVLPEPLIDHPRYRIIKLLGSGGMGAVYQAEHRVMERAVALKVINPNLINDTQAIDRFEQEVKAAARLAHPNIVTAYDAEQAGNLHYLVMEFVEGVSLAQLVEKRGPLPVLHSCEYIRQAALGLQHAFEQGMVHRDIKPQNLMLSPKGRIKILDFGLARFVSESSKNASITAQGVVMGTPDYMAPEQAMDPRQADIRADIYSLGCTLYFILTGQVTFPEGTVFQKLLAHVEQAPKQVSAFRADVPPGLVAVLDRMMAKDPARRYQKPIEVARDLAGIIKGGAALNREATQEGAPPSDQATHPGVELLTFDLREPSPPSPPARKGNPRKSGKKIPRSGGKENEPWIQRRNVQILGAATGLLLVLGLVALVAMRTTNTKDERERKVVEVDRPPTAPVKPVAKKPEEPARITGQEPVGEIRVMTGHTKDVSGVIFLPGGRRALSTSFDGSIRVWDLAAAKEVRRFSAPDTEIWSMALSKDGSRLLTGSADAMVRLWDVNKGTALQLLQGHGAGVTGVAFSPDGHTVLSAGDDEAVRLWDLDEDKELRNFVGNQTGYANATFSPDGRRLATVSLDHALRVWDVENWKELAFLDGHTATVSRVVFTPDGRYLLSGSFDWTLRLREAESGREVRRFLGNKEGIYSLAMSVDGHRALTGGGDGIMRLWDVAIGLEVRGFEGHSGPVSAVAFSADGQMALSGGKDGTVRLWRLPEVGAKPSPAPAVTPQLAWPAEALKQGKVLAPDLAGLKPLFQDQFANPASGFARTKTEECLLDYVDGKYVIRTTGASCSFSSPVPSEALTDFACQVVGRVTGPAVSFWGLSTGTKEGRGVQVAVNGEGKLDIVPAPGEPDKFRGPHVGRLPHSAIQRGDKFNTLLVIVRGRVVEVYANGVAVTDPVVVDRDITPAKITIAASADPREAQVEFESVTIWPAAGLPTPEARGAVATPR